MKSKSTAIIQWIFLLLAVFFWILYLRGTVETAAAIIASISSVVFGILFCYELFD